MVTMKRVATLNEPIKSFPGREQEICSNISILGSRVLFSGRGKDVVPPKKKGVLARENNSFSRTAPNKINAILHKTAILNAWHGSISMVVKVITVFMVISDTVTSDTVTDWAH